MVESSEKNGFRKPQPLLNAGEGEDTIDEVYPRIYMSSFVPPESADLLDQCGITHILSVMPYVTDKFAKSHGVKYCLLNNIKDDDNTNVLQYFPEGIAFIKQALADHEHNRVLVHCAAGRSRSGAFCCAYMIQEQGMTLQEAIAYGQKRRGKFLPNLNFQAQLRCLENAVKKVDWKEKLIAEAASVAQVQQKK